MFSTCPARSDAAPGGDCRAPCRADRRRRLAADRPALRRVGQTTTHLGRGAELRRRCRHEDLAAGAGPARGLRIVDELEAGGELDHYHLLHTTRADLLRRGGIFPEAADACRRAIPLCSSPIERRFLERRLAQIEALS